MNSIDYNEEFDQILLSSRFQNEIWIIDHSTSTEEAAGHTGGRYGKGGDLLYRWGNPQIYDMGSENDRILFGQHDARWIDSGYPGEGNILIFNNGVERPDGYYSTVDEITPPVDESGNYIRSEGLPFGPTETTWTYKPNTQSELFGSSISGSQRLSNGNTMICNGPSGKFIELTPNFDTVWTYVNLYPTAVTNSVFKTQCYDSDYPGLSNLF